MSVISAILSWIAGLFGGARDTSTFSVHERPSPHFSPRRGSEISMVIIHGDAGRTDEGTISWIQDPASKVSYHYFIGRDGRIYQFVEDEMKAWHAGFSHWHGREVGNSVNPISIGVCFANDGTGDEPYRPIQYREGAKLVRSIMDEHGVHHLDILGHHQVSPGRKTDPWSYFDWDHFLSLL